MGGNTTTKTNAFGSRRLFRTILRVDPFILGADGCVGLKHCVAYRRPISVGSADSPYADILELADDFGLRFRRPMEPRGPWSPSS